MSHITPTVGRVILVRSELPHLTGCEEADREVPALVTRVHSIFCVDAMVMRSGPNATPINVASITHVDAPERIDGVTTSWRWIPYQKQVAGKTEQLLAAAEPRKPDAALAAQDAEAAAVAKTPDRVTLEHIEALVAGESYHTPLGTLLTLCTLTLRNGFTVTGESAAADPKNFDEALGRRIARRHAVEKIWPLEGYLVRQRLHDGSDHATPYKIAEIAHEVNRAWCAFQGDHSQAAWVDAPEWQRESAVDGVRFHLANPDAGDSASHDNWRRHKEADGWTYGPRKDPKAKQHPCMVDFEDLPAEQQFKDRLFRTIVHAAR